MALLTGYLHKLTDKEKDMVKKWVRESKAEYSASNRNSSQALGCLTVKRAETKGNSAKRRKSH